MLQCILAIQILDLNTAEVNTALGKLDPAQGRGGDRLTGHVWIIFFNFNLETCEV
jgi:hypothetical protein